MKGKNLNEMLYKTPSIHDVTGWEFVVLLLPESLSNVEISGLVCE